MTDEAIAAKRDVSSLAIEQRLRTHGFAMLLDAAAQHGWNILGDDVEGVAQLAADITAKAKSFATPCATKPWKNMPLKFTIGL